MTAMGRVLVVAALLAVLGCATKPAVMVPPRIDLKEHERIGILRFVSTAEGDIATLATRRFTELARADQGVVRIVEVPAGRHQATDPASLQALGRELGLRTIVLGELTVSDVRPDVRVATDLRSGSLNAQVDATLDVRMVEIATGASIWNRSARASRSVGGVSVFGVENVSFDAADPERAYGPLVDTLVEEVTRDFRVRWERP
jgi:hypothetical protein